MRHSSWTVLLIPLALPLVLLFFQGATGGLHRHGAPQEIRIERLAEPESQSGRSLTLSSQSARPSDDSGTELKESLYQD